MANSARPESAIPERLQDWHNGHKNNASSLGCIHVKGKRSRYLGLSDRMAMLGHFEEAKDFIMKSFACESTSTMMNEMSAFQKLTVRKTKGPERIYPPLGRAGLVAEMLKSIPKHYSWDMLFSALPYWEGVTRILHVPSFRAECNEIISIVRAGVDALPPITRESLVPQLLATLALSARLGAGFRHSESDKISETQVGLYAILIQQWMDSLGGKERLNFYSLQTQALLLLVHQNNNGSPSALWRESGDLVRSAMIMGLHLDPEEYFDFSIFQKEQRRKLWRTIVELDIQFSLAASMPTALRTTDFQAGELRNVNDLELSEGMVEYPADKGPNIWTDATAQIALGPSLRERLDATNKINGIFYLDADAPFLLQQASDLEKGLQNLPISLKSDTGSSTGGDKSPMKLFSTVMLDVFIRRPSFSIYSSIALSPLRNRYPEARKGAIRSSIELLSHLDALDPTVADLNVIKDRDLLNLFHVICKNDIIQAAYFLCYEIQKFSQPLQDEVQGGFGMVDDGTWTKHSLTRIVENTLNSLLQRLGQFGSDLKDVLPLSIVLQSVRSGGTREEKIDLMLRGAERVWNACRSEMPSIKGITMRSPDDSSDIKNPVEHSAQLPAGWDGVAAEYNDLSMMGIDVDFNDFDAGFNNLAQSWL